MIPWTDNLVGHSQDEVPCGFISKIDNPIQFIKTEDSRTMIRVLGKNLEKIFWKVN